MAKIDPVTRNVSLVAFVLGSAIVLYVISQQTKTETWTDGNYEFRDTRNRWTGRIQHRSICTYQDGKLESMFDGPMTESGKPHGEWSIIGGSVPPFSKKYYWYGEEISEGEWASRN